MTYEQWMAEAERLVGVFGRAAAFVGRGAGYNKDAEAALSALLSHLRSRPAAAALTDAPNRPPAVCTCGTLCQDKGAPTCRYTRNNSNGEDTTTPKLNNCAGCVNEDAIGGPCRTCVDSSNRQPWDE